MIVHAVFAMNVGLRVFRGGDHFEKSSPRRVTDQHHKLKNSLRPIGRVLSLMNVCSGVTNCPKRASSARPFVCQFRTSGSSPAGRKRTRKFGGVEAHLIE